MQSIEICRLYELDSVSSNIMKVYLLVNGGCIVCSVNVLYFKQLQISCNSGLFALVI